MRLEHIITVCEQTTEHITDLTSEMLERYIPYVIIKLYGIPFDWNEDKVENVFNEKEEAVPIGEISGYYVLGQAIYLNGGDILYYSDSISQELENAVSALMENDGPLKEDGNLFHITEFNISENLDEGELEKLFIELPDIIFTHMHVSPDIISFSPAPLPHEKSKLKQVQEGLAMIAFYEAQKRNIDPLFNKSSKIVASDSPQIQISPEQLNIVMGRRNIGDSYPEEYIDSDAWKPFIEAGFEEWKQTRVLYNQVF
ncbi:hypothetical protein [Ruminococcus sp.]|uniref:hypothetical protein n=1 Tax=Ruminococcus sp. TaxID=41978 RepID=UPI0025ED692A|nr:hypothetical protein [Ruminococcus sp.]